MTTETSVDLDIAGMTCSSCAARIEKKLNRLDGVTASVNYATERAHVAGPADLDPAVLIAEVARTGYSASLPTPEAADESEERGEDPELRSLRQRLIGAAVLAAPVIAMAMVPALQFDSWGFASLVLAAPVVVWAGWPFHRAAAVNLRHGAATMDTLISVGTIAALLWSIVALFLGTAGQPGVVHPFELTIQPGDGLSHIYLEVAAGVVTFVLAGRCAEKRAKARAGQALRDLLALGAKEATVLRDGVETAIPIEELARGDEFIVRPGEKIAADGIVVRGESAVDASMITGEPVPVDVGPGDQVTGSCVNASGRIVVRAEAVGADTQLAQMARLVEEAQSGKAEVQRLADRISGVFVPIAITIAVATLGAWIGAGFPLAAGFTAAVTVLIIACPCALGLATPTALLVGTGRGAQLGILIKGPEVLESSGRIDTIVLDKTGTVTTGVMALTEVLVSEDADRAQVLRRSGALESASEHPIARSIAEAARQEIGTLPEVEEFENLAGRGVRGRVDGEPVIIGRPELLVEEGLVLGTELADALDRARARGHTAVLVGWAGEACGLLVVGDEVKPGSAEAIAGFTRLGLRTVLLTGDHEAVAQRVAREVGIGDVIAGVLPSGKVQAIASLQAQGRTVAMMGDGVNDAPALAQADLGLAMGTGTDVAIEAADITLVRGDLRAGIDAIRLSRRTLGTIKGNLFWAFAYNTAAIPVAALGLLNPMLAGAAMAVSSLFVLGNSLRLRTFRAA